MSATIDPVTALAIAHERRREDIRRAEQHRLTRQAQQRRLMTRKATNRAPRHPWLRRLWPHRSAPAPT